MNSRRNKTFMLKSIMLPLFFPGLACNFYFFADEPSVEKSDIQNFSLNFGFIFGKFN